MPSATEISATVKPAARSLGRSARRGKAHTDAVTVAPRAPRQPG
jgi:hypothetical protein